MRHYCVCVCVFVSVFHSLLKAHAIEARGVVRQALEILTPSMPVRMEDGNTMLTHWTKKIIVEEGHSVQQLFHILQLVVRHYKVCTASQMRISQNPLLLPVSSHHFPPYFLWTFFILYWIWAKYLHFLLFSNKSFLFSFTSALSSLPDILQYMAMPSFSRLSNVSLAV